MGVTAQIGESGGKIKLIGDRHTETGKVSNHIVSARRDRSLDRRRRSRIKRRPTLCGAGIAELIAAAPARHGICAKASNQHVVIQTAVNRIAAASTVNSIAAGQTVQIVRQRATNQPVRAAICRQDLNSDSTYAWSCADAVADAVAESSCTRYIPRDELHPIAQIDCDTKFRRADIDNVQRPFLLRVQVIGARVDECRQQVIRTRKYDAVIDSNWPENSRSCHRRIKRIDVNSD